MQRMDWARLLSNSRLGRESEPPSQDVRSEFQRDADRIIYSSAFRRLQDKAQVFPLAESDYVRTRLTHSLEVASVGRSLGTLVGALVARKGETDVIAAAEFGNAVAAACLAHDIGNPPFGHSGEDAIREWFATSGRSYLRSLSEGESEDFLRFEGNAQGFRILTRLQHPQNKGGLQLTHAVLATFTKYPRRSKVADLAKSKNVSEKKFGFVEADAPSFERVAAELGLVKKHEGAWARHPLAFLVEAADDICYNVIDLEDACRIGCVSPAQGEALLMPIASALGGAALDTIEDPRSRLEYLRAKAINNLIYAAVDVFDKNYDAIMEGRYERDLAADVRFAEEMKEIKSTSERHIYTAPVVVHIEAAGFEVLSGLLSRLVPALVEREKQRRSTKKLLELVPPQYRCRESTYERLLAATDLVSGMTDSFATTLYRRITGIELPGW